MKRILSSICLSLLYLSSCLNAEVQNVDELKQHVFKVLPSLHGWCSKEKAVNFIDLVIEVDPEVCVEIGVFGGSSLFPVASALKYLGHGIVIGIDPWDKLESLKNFDPLKDEEHINWWSKVNFDRIYYAYLNVLKKHGLEDFVLTEKKTSKAAVKEISSIDVLYIDGDHSEEGIANDVALYLPKVRGGGYIWLNDALSEHAQMGIDLLLEQCEMVKLIDSGNCVLFKKTR